MGKPFILTTLVACSLSLIACQTSSTHPSGALRFQFQNAQQRIKFELKAIPSETTHFEIQVTGTGLSSPRTLRIPFSSTQTQSHTLTELPIGNKLIAITALNDQIPLARGQGQSVIVANETAQAEITLTPIEQADLALELDQVVPLDLNIKLTISGVGLASPQQKNMTLKSGQKSVSLGKLPPGPKKAEVSISADIEGRTLQAPLQKIDFNIDATGKGILKLSVSELVGNLENQLDGLLERIDINDLKNLLLTMPLERLQQLASRLRPILRERLLSIPEIRVRISESPAPSASPMPSPSAIPIDTGRFLADARLVFQVPADPNALLKEAIGTSVIGQNQALETGASNTILSNGAWGLSVRVRAATGAFIPYSLQIRRRQTDGDVMVHSFNGDLRQQFEIAGETYQGDHIVFNGADRVPLAAGNYLATLGIRNPVSRDVEIYTFVLNVPAFGG